jgi:rhodanese-related sulfurtransferase/DNA-binding transcriptional ArsR family regulator
MSRTSPKGSLFVQFAAVAKAMAHPLRLELLEHIAQGERSVELLAARVGISIANASQHLQQLRRAGLVSAERRGKYIFYALTDDAVLQLFAALRRVGERHSAEVGQIVRGYFEKRDSMEAVSHRELMQRLKDGLAVVLDVRPEDEFALGHVPGALNVPLSELKKRLGKLDLRQEVIAYCRGPYCVLAYEAVALLRSRGFSARRLQDGMPEWRAAGLPVETGSSVHS